MPLIQLDSGYGGGYAESEGEENCRHTVVYSAGERSVGVVVGKIVDTLDETGLRDNTLLIFLGDNGTAVGITSMMGDSAVPGGKGKTTDNGTHVPLIANWPGVVPSGAVNADLIASTDFFPTLLEAAELDRPQTATPDGRSFYPQLRGESGQPREWIYCRYERNGKRNKASHHIRNQNSKLYPNPTKHP